MVMSRIFSFMLLLSVVCAVFLGNGAALAAAVTEGAQSGITLVVSMAGSLCLWSGVGKLMDEGLSRKDAVKQTAKDLNLPKNVVYDAALK